MCHVSSQGVLKHKNMQINNRAEQAGGPAPGPSSLSQERHRHHCALQDAPGRLAGYVICGLMWYVRLLLGSLFICAPMYVCLLVSLCRSLCDCICVCPSSVSIVHSKTPRADLQGAWSFFSCCVSACLGSACVSCGSRPTGLRTPLDPAVS